MHSSDALALHQDEHILEGRIVASGFRVWAGVLEIHHRVMQEESYLLEAESLPEGCPRFTSLDRGIVDHPHHHAAVLGHSEEFCGNGIEVEAVALVHSEIVVGRGSDRQIDRAAVDELQSLHAVHVVDSISREHHVTPLRERSSCSILST